jgi:GTP-binding protein EngB required for normal cell division
MNKTWRLVDLPGYGFAAGAKHERARFNKAVARYVIYAVADLTQLFVPIMQITATSTGPASYLVSPVAPVMFYIVEQLPAGD